MGRRGRDCYCTSCTIFSDSFSSDDLATNWTQQSGTWSIGSGVLSTSSSNAVVTCNTAYPGGGFHAYTVQATLTAVTGSRSRVIVNYSGGTYDCVEIYWNGASSYVYLKNSSGSILSTSVIQSFTNGTTYSFLVCVTATGIVVNLVTALVPFVVGAAISSTSTICGLGSGMVSSTVYCTAFSFNYAATDVAGCPACNGSCSLCNSAKIPIQLKVVIPALTAGTCTCGTGTPNCSLLSGTFIASTEGSCGWYYQESGPICSNALNPNLNVTLTQSGSNYLLNVVFVYDTTGCTTSFQWQKTYTSLPDCSSWNSEALNWVGGHAEFCDGFGTQALVTAL